MERPPNPNAWLARYARELGIPKKALLVLAADNDPFNAGTKGHAEQAEWFTDIYRQVGQRGIHLRRLHYRAYDASVPNRQGEPYPNTEEQWKELQDASKYARHLGLVDPEDFRDNRAPDPYLSVHGLPFTPGPAYEMRPGGGLLDWYLPSINTSLRGHATPAVEHEVSGYEYADYQQPLLVEVWSEKSGDDAVLGSIATQYGINYVPGIGFQSVTNIRRMFRRIRDVGKPTRVLYLSDFDPAGMGMPVQVGRHTQFAFWQLAQLASEEDVANVKLEALALTEKQVVELQLPRKPIKEEDRRKVGWEDRFGEGAVEIDALEARQPGSLGRLVSERVEALQDGTVSERIAEARQEAGRRVEEAGQDVVERHRTQAQQTVSEFNEVADRYRERLEVLSAEFEREVGPLRQRFTEQEEAFERELGAVEVELPEMPEAVAPEEDDGDELRWMYDSDREFVQQTEEFRRRQKRE
jgi:hypothetical protein